MKSGWPILRFVYIRDCACFAFSAAFCFSCSARVPIIAERRSAPLHEPTTVNWFLSMSSTFMLMVVPSAIGRLGFSIGRPDMGSSTLSVGTLAHLSLILSSLINPAKPDCNEMCMRPGV